MPRFVAFLGGINVGGHRVTMERLRAEFERAGVSSVSTFIASGNVIFESKSQGSALEQKIEAKLLGALGYAVPTFVRAASEVIAIANHAPFGALVEGDTQLVAFMRAPPSPAAKKATEALANDVDALMVRKAELYWRIHGKSMDSRLKVAAITKTLGHPFTLRNVKSLRKLAGTLA